MASSGHPHSAAWPDLEPEALLPASKRAWGVCTPQVPWTCRHSTHRPTVMGACHECPAAHSWAGGHVASPLLGAPNTHSTSERVGNSPEGATIGFHSFP